MRRLKQLPFLVIAIILAMVNARDVSAAASSKVVLAQVVHRHGARTPTSIHGDHKWACGPIGCGILTAEGKDMLFQLGLFARERYMLLPGTNASGTAYIANTSFYFPKRMVQRSTDKSRTLQSAAAFLQGFFDRDPSSFYPSVSTVPLDTDSQWYVSSIPAFELNHDVHKAKEDLAFTQDYLLPAINASVWAALGAEFRLKGCGSASSETLKHEIQDKNETVMDCFKEVYDVAEAYYSMGILDKFPLASAYYGTLRQLTFEHHAQLFVWNPETHTDSKRGPLGRNAVDTLVQRMHEYMNQTDADAQFFEYSVEDTMLCSLSDTLGQPQFQLPQFGDAWFFELLLDQRGTYSLRIFHGAPTQEPGMHRYTFSPFNITCQTAGGTVYTDADGVCPLSDFLTWYATQVGTSGEGYCYLRPDVRSALHCDKAEAKAPHEKCGWYRRMCPQYACPSGSYLSYPLLNCVSV